MKKFISCISLQFKLEATVYHNETKIEMLKPQPTRFPILEIIRNNVEEGEEISVVSILYDKDLAHNNYKTFCNDLDQLSEKMGFTIKNENKIILNTPFNEHKNSHLKLLKKLMETINIEDELYGCITYGNKTIPLLIFAAFNYAQLSKKAYIHQIVYGQILDFEKPEREGKLFDVTSLLYLNSLVEKASESQNPGLLIELLLKDL